MIILNRDLNIELSPREVADEIWDMASDEQASLLNNLADIYEAFFPNFCMQLECVRGEFENDYSEAEQKKVVRMLETMVEYFDRRGENE
jgi:hypothetical protein